MHKHYNEYYWKNGKPYGRHIAESLSGITYRIVIDPYHKRYSLERYLEGNFDKVLYDSALFDFRHLRQPEQASWQKVPLTSESSLIRNHDDRVILLEHYRFEEGRCRECALFSPQGTHLSTHRMYWRSLGDPFDGVILYDPEGLPIMKKTYALLPDSEEFGELLEESWEESWEIVNLK